MENESEMLRNMVEQSPQGVYIIKIIKDEEGNPVDWVFLYCNDAMAGLGPIPKEQLIGQRFTELFPNANLKWLGSYCKAAYENQTLEFDEFSEEIGTYIHLKVMPVGQKDCCCCYISDIKKELAAVFDTASEKEKAQRTSALLDALCMEYLVVYLCDLKKDTIEETIKLSPYSHSAVAEEIIPEVDKTSYSIHFRWLFDHIIIKESAPDYWEELKPEKLMETLRHQESFEIQNRTIYSRGGLEYFSVKAVRLSYDEESFRVVIGIRPIGNQIKKELENQKRLQEAVAEAELANEAKSNFLRRMSHDIRTPINGIRGMIEIADYYPNDLEKQQECRNKILQATDHLLSLVNDVLDMSKLESGKFTLRNDPFDLRKILDEVNTVAAAQAEEFNVHFIHKDTERVEHQYLLGSPVYLKRIFLNFMSNAIKYNKEDGQVVVTGREISFDGKTAWYEFSCEDTGIGMSKEFQQHAFEPFTQEEKNGARTKYAGTGLGLAITKQLIDLMGGTLEMHSVEGKGTKMTFRLPFEVDLGRHHKKIDYTAIRFEGIRALLVEDNELNAEIATFMLEKHGIKVTWVQNGKQAIDVFARNPEEYDIIFMDVMMPIMGGLESTREIRKMEKGKKIPILAMTANAFTDDVQRSLEAGMDRHLTKPLQEKEIIKAIYKLCK